MKKNGFTLTEILAVMIILSLLVLIIAPNLLTSIKNRKPQVTETQKQMIQEAANLYADSYFGEDTNTGDTLCITIQELINKGYLSDNISDATTTKNDSNFKSQSVSIINSSPRTIEIKNCTP